MFEARRPSAEFIHALARFNFTYGYIAAIVMYAGDDLGPERAKHAGGTAVATKAYTNKKWVSHLVARQIARGRERQLAERDLAKAINKLTEQDLSPDAFPLEWYKRLLGADGQLRSAYTGKRLPLDELSRLAQESTADIPPTDFHVPET
jgi:hypothetical protein